MRRTIPRKRPRTSPHGDTERECSYCGVVWLRSQLRRDAAGLLACPDDVSGLDAVTLSEGNANWASQHRMGQFTGESDGGIEPPNTTPAPPFKNPNGPPVNRAQGGPTGPLSVQVFAWMRADFVQLDSNGKVETWPDMNQTRSTVTQANPALRPDFALDPTLGGLPTVQLTDATRFLRAAVNRSGPLWFWGIVQQLSWSGSNSPLWNAGYQLTQSGTSPQLHLFGNYAGTVNGGAPVGGWSRVMSNNTVAGTDYLTVRGVTVTDSGAGLRNSSGFTIGNTAATAPVAYAEGLWTFGPPTAAEIAAIEAYGVLRYGGSPFV